ncbi:MAG: hypothetical protein ABJK25_12380 [Halieaceae bacterium]
MNWDALGAISEALGAAGVIASLIYLATQIHAQNRESRMAASREVTDAFRESVSSMQDEQRANVVWKAMQDMESLAPPEKLQINAIAQQYLRVWEQAHHQHSEGRLEQESWEAMNTQFIDFMALDVISSVWKIRKNAFRASFREYVDSLDAGSYQL